MNVGGMFGEEQVRDEESPRACPPVSPSQVAPLTPTPPALSALLPRPIGAGAVCGDSRWKAVPRSAINQKWLMHSYASKFLKLRSTMQ